MPNALRYLALHELGLVRHPKFIEHKKAVLDILEYEAAKPVHNQPCHFSGESRATFLVDFSPNMLRAASTHGDHTVRVTDIQKGKCTHILTGHPRTPWCVAFNPTSSDILASGCLAGEVRIWDLLGGGSEVLQNPSSGAVITSLAFHPSGQVLVFATVNCIYFWDWTKPSPFAATKTAHEYERIRWLRFDPFSQYLFTGIANNTTVHRESARNIIHMRRENATSESRSQDQARRRRYNRLIERYQAFRQRLNATSSDYLEHINPRSPVQEENLSMARQYAGHVTETTALQSAQASLPQSSTRVVGHRLLRLHFLLSSLNGDSNGGSNAADSAASESHAGAHPIALPESSLSSSRLAETNTLGAASSTAAASGEVDRNTRRRWGRYQPSFFASDRNNNDRPGYDNNNNDYSQENPNLMTLPSSGPGQPPLSSLPLTSTSAFSPWVTESTSSFPGNDGLEHNEFEILPIEQEETSGPSLVPSTSEQTGRRYPSPETHRQELQSLLRRYRTTLSVLSSSYSSSSSSSSGHQAVAGANNGGGQTSSPGVSMLLTNAVSTSTVARSGSIPTDFSLASSSLSVPVISSSVFNNEEGTIHRRSSSLNSSIVNAATEAESLNANAPRLECPSSSGPMSVPVTTACTGQNHDAEIRPCTSPNFGCTTTIGGPTTQASDNLSEDGGGEGSDRLAEYASLRTPCPCTSESSNELSSVPFYRGLAHAIREPTVSSSTTSDLLGTTSAGTMTQSVNPTSVISHSTRSDNFSASMNLSGSTASSSVSSSCSATQNVNTRSSSGPYTTSSGVLNIPKGHLLRTKLSEVTVTTAPGLPLSRNYHMNSSPNIVIHPANSVTSSSSDSRSFTTGSRLYQLGRDNSDSVINTFTDSVLDTVSLFSSAHEQSADAPQSSIFSRVCHPSRCHSSEMPQLNATINSQSSSRSRVESSDASTSGVAADPVAEVQERLQQAVQQLRDVQSRVQELTSSSTYSANLAHAASVTEYLEQRVSDIDRRISDLEHRVESSGYLLSNNPFYQSHVGQHRPVTSRRRPLSNMEPGQNRSSLGQLHRSSRVMPYLPAMSSFRGPPSHRTLSFNPSSSSSAQPSSTVSSSSSSAAFSGAAASASLPLSISIQADAERDEDVGISALGDDSHSFRRRGGSSGARETDWRGLQHVHLHTDYSSSILDDTINRQDDAMQQIMSRTIAGAFLSRDEQAVANNIVPQTHRIQRWEISQCVVPDISDANKNIVVEHCKLHNDASCDISRDGSALATFVPSHRGFPDDNILGVFSLQKETFGQCLYTKSFGPNAISVSISPANHYVMVGLAAKRCFFFAMPSQLVGQVYRLVRRKAGEKSMTHVTDLYHPCNNRGLQGHISVNSGRWLPGIGEGIVYGTNRGDLHFCRPGPRKLPELEAPESRGIHKPDLTSSGWRLRPSVRSHMATQTGTSGVRRSSSTQTPDEELANR